MTARKTVYIYAALFAYTIAPVLSVLVATSIAKLTGTTLDEGGVYPCLVFGVDIGGALSSMFVLGWLSAITLPTGGLAILISSFVRPQITPAKGERLHREKNA